MFRYDVVGCGEVVAQEHGLVLSRLQSEGVLEVRACIDTSTDRAARMAKRLHSRAVESVDRAGVSGADAALIATPPEFHTDLALQYLLAGRSVLIEKSRSRQLCRTRKGWSMPPLQARPVCSLDTCADFIQRSKWHVRSSARGGCWARFIVPKHARALVGSGGARPLRTW